MDVMPTGVHHPDFGAALVANFDFTGIIQPGLLNDGQGIHIRANQDRRPLSILEDADDARLADTGRHLEAECLHLLGESCGRLFLAQR